MCAFTLLALRCVNILLLEARQRCRDIFALKRKTIDGRVAATAGVPVYILPTGQLGTVPSSRPVSSTGPGTTSALQELKAIIAEQQKQIEALTAGLQKVSAQLELSKSAPKTAKNDD